MPTLHVCPLSRLADTVAATEASHVLTLVNVGTTFERPAAIALENHAVIGVSDIATPMDGHVLPAEEHVAAILAFVRGWPRDKPLVIHCYAGISRSTAAAYIIAACALAPERDEAAIAAALRAASPSATPNRSSSPSPTGCSADRPDGWRRSGSRARSRSVRGHAVHAGCGLRASWDGNGVECGANAPVRRKIGAGRGLRPGGFGLSALCNPP